MYQVKKYLKLPTNMYAKQEYILKAIHKLRNLEIKFTEHIDFLK